MYQLKRSTILESIELAHAIVDLISDVKGEDIHLIDLREITPIADYFVICTGNSERQLRAIVEKITEEIKRETRIRPFRTEGDSSGGWVLIDYGSVVVHAFTPEQRAYYNLEEFWSEGKTIVHMQ